MLLNVAWHLGKLDIQVLMVGAGGQYHGPHDMSIVLLI